MTDGIGRIFGGNSYGLGGYVPQRKDEVPEEAQAPIVQPETKNVSPDEVMRLLSANNLSPVKPEFKMVELAPDVAARAAEAMAGLERFLSVAAEEVGDDLALVLADEYSAQFVK